VQDQLEGVARERVDAFSQRGGVVARLPSGGEPVSCILANLSIQQRKQVGVGTVQGRANCKKKFDNEGYTVVLRISESETFIKIHAGFLNSVADPHWCGCGWVSRGFVDQKFLL
jgi:hypothetical protein